MRSRNALVNLGSDITLLQFCHDGGGGGETDEEKRTRTKRTGRGWKKNSPLLLTATRTNWNGTRGKSPRLTRTSSSKTSRRRAPRSPIRGSTCRGFHSSCRCLHPTPGEPPRRPLPRRRQRRPATAARSVSEERPPMAPPSRPMKPFSSARQPYFDFEWRLISSGCERGG